MASSKSGSAKQPEKPSKAAKPCAAKSKLSKPMQSSKAEKPGKKQAAPGKKQAAGSQEIKIKRGRGRPPKEVKTVEVDEANEDEDMEE
ncbi:hypothetical protein HDU76_009991 [Blyttiomyces sp. JEL0837]|nr:hypothetical protein HDU76_009991 [Blyttiomyces sp. JEL0837]